MQKYLKIIDKLILILTMMTGIAYASAPPLKVVASFSVLENLVEEIGGSSVVIDTLVDRNSDPHVFQPTPDTLIKIQSADLVVINGLGFEPWLDKILIAEETTEKSCLATKGIDVKWVFTPHQGNAVADPHAWHSLHNIEIYARNIRDCLSTYRPDQKNTFNQRYDAFVVNVRRLKKHLVEEIRLIPKEKRKVITGHDAFGYLSEEFDITFKAPLGVSTEEKASAKIVANLITQIKAEGIRALFIESLSNSDLITQIANDTGIDIQHNILYADALSEKEGPASTYLEMMRFNVESLIREMNNNEAVTVER